MPDQSSKDRREFLRSAALGIAATPLILSSSAQVQSAITPPAASAKNTTFAALKQITAGVLDVGYAEDGCVYRKPKPAHNGYEARSGLGVKR